MSNDAASGMMTKMTPELRSRIIYGVIASIITLAFIFVFGQFAAFGLALLAALKGWHEYCRMMNLTRRPSLHIAGYVMLTLMFTQTFFVGPKSFFWVWALWLVAFGLFFLEGVIARREGRPDPAEDTMQTWTHLCRFVLGCLYIFMLLGLVGPILGRVRGEQVLTMALVVVFAGDSAAYFVGKRHGRRKLWPELSPKKTVEGALGGWAGSLVGGLICLGLFKLIFKDSVGLLDTLAMAVILPPLAQAGDFLESLMKRAANIKDSGSLLPGHGGVLDRIDSFVFVVPVVYFLF